MQKRILTMVLTLACLALAVPALAEVFTGGSVTLEVPAGWSPMYNELTKQALAASPDQNCVASVQIIPTDGKSDQQLAELLSKELGGSTPEPADKGGYFFTANHSGMPMVINVAASDNKALVFMEIGAKENYPDELQLIRASLKSDDPAEQELLSTVQ